MKQQNYLETILTKNQTINRMSKKLINYLIKRFKLENKVLELGCGRGEFLNELKNLV